GAVAVGLVRRSLTVVLAATAVTAAALLALVALVLGLPPERIAGLALVLSVVLSGSAGQLALGGAGLVDLMVADEQGERVPRARVVQATRWGRAIATGMSWGGALVATPSL